MLSSDINFDQNALIEHKIYSVSDDTININQVIEPSSAQ